MERKHKIAYFQIFETVLTAIVTWVINKLLASLAKRIRKTKLNIDTASIIKRLLDSDTHLVAVFLDLHPAEVKFAMQQGVKSGPLQAIKSFSSLWLYSYYKEK